MTRDVEMRRIYEKALKSHENYFCLFEIEHQRYDAVVMPSLFQIKLFCNLGYYYRLSAMC